MNHGAGLGHIPPALTRSLPWNPSPLRTRGLVKRYGDVKALDGVDLEVREGETFGVIRRRIS